MHYRHHDTSDVSDNTFACCLREFWQDTHTLLAIPILQLLSFDMSLSCIVDVPGIPLYLALFFTSIASSLPWKGAYQSLVAEACQMSSSHVLVYHALLTKDIATRDLTSKKLGGSVRHRLVCEICTWVGISKAQWVGLPTAYPSLARGHKKKQKLEKKKVWLKAFLFFFALRLFGSVRAASKVPIGSQAAL